MAAAAAASFVPSSRPSGSKGQQGPRLQQQGQEQEEEGQQ